MEIHRGIAVVVFLLSWTAPALGFSVSGQVSLPGLAGAEPVSHLDPAGCGPGGTQEVIVSRRGGLKNVVVTVASGNAKGVVAGKPRLISARSCEFDPHVIVLTEGQGLNIRNLDGVTHDLRIFHTGNFVSREILGVGAAVWNVPDLARGDYVLRCGIHHWMFARIVVTDTAFYAVTDEEGRYRIEGLSEGRHLIHFWHEKFGTAERTTQGTADEEVVNVAFEKNKIS